MHAIGFFICLPCVLSACRPTIGKYVMPPQHAYGFAQARGPKRVLFHQRVGICCSRRIDDPCATRTGIAIKQRASGPDAGGMTGKKRQMVGHMRCADMIVFRGVFEQDEIGHCVSFFVLPDPA